MAHIPDGVLSGPVLALGAVVTVAGCGYGLRRLTPAAIPQTGILAALFFIASLVHFPVGPASVHLILNGLVGVMLGWVAFPAIAAALLLQAVLFGFGGVVVLGVNIMNMAVPAVLCGLLFRMALRRLVARPQGPGRWGGLAGGGAGALGVMLTALAVAGSLAVSGREFMPAAQLIMVTHVPVMGVEAVFTAAVVAVVLRVRPTVFSLPESSTGKVPGARSKSSRDAWDPDRMP